MIMQLPYEFELLIAQIHNSTRNRKNYLRQSGLILLRMIFVYLTVPEITGQDKS